MPKKKKETKKKTLVSQEEIERKLSSNSYQWGEILGPINQIDKWMFNKITKKILEDGGLEQFISFDETPDGGCFQNELLTWIMNENKSNEIFETPTTLTSDPISNKNELKKLNDWLEECSDQGRGYRPTLIVDSANEKDYSLAEKGEDMIGYYETNGALYAASFAAENNMDLDLIYEAWGENGNVWEDEVNALKLFSQKKKS